MHIVAAWELGGGRGHIMNLLPTLRELTERGHRVTFLSRDLVSAATLMRGLPVRVLPAPFRLAAIASRLPPAASYPEMLLRIGYDGDAATVTALLRAWVELFELLRADAVLCEHAPSALLAAHALGLPRAVFGTGFMVPPHTTPMPTFASLIEAPAARVAQAEQTVLDTMNAALQGLGAAPLQAVAHLFSGAARFLCTLPEIDHYPDRRDATYWGPPDLLLPQSAMPPPWPAAGQQPLFAYLHASYPAFAGLLRYLQAADHRTLLVSPGMHPDQARALSRPHLRVTPDMVSLAGVAAQRPLLVTHAGHGTIAAVLLRGLPALLLPRYVEQTVLALRLARQQLAVMASPDVRTHRYGPLLERLRDSPRLWASAAALARRHAHRFDADQPRLLGEAVEGALRRVSPVGHGAACRNS